MIRDIASSAAYAPHFPRDVTVERNDNNEASHSVHLVHYNRIDPTGVHDFSATM